MMELDHAPLAPFMNERLPGMSPLDYADWLHRDDAFAAQMAYRDRLLAERPDLVLMGEGCKGAEELLDLVLDTLRAHDPDYEIGETEVRRPDGVTVPIDRTRPCATFARLVQEDLLLLDRPEGGEEHVLIGGALLFPSRWSFAEKFGQPLLGIHARVPAYDDGLAPRVQRLFDALRPERPMVRANWLLHPTPELHQPKTYSGTTKIHEDTGRFWLRVERQSILKLPVSGAAVFSIKTLVTPIEALSAEEREGLIEAIDHQSVEMRDYHGGAPHNARARDALAALN